MGWRIRVVDACEISSNRKSIQVTPAKRPDGGPLRPEAEEDEYEYYDDDAPETTSAEPVVTVKDDGSLAEGPFHSSFPSDFTNFFSSSITQDDERPPRSEEKPNKPVKDDKEVTDRIPTPSQKVNQLLDEDISDGFRQNHKPGTVEPPNRNRQNPRPNTVEPPNRNLQNHRSETAESPDRNRPRPLTVEVSNRNRQNQPKNKVEFPERPPQLQFGFQDGFKSVQSQITVGQSQQQQEPSRMKPGRVIPVHTAAPNRNRPGASISGSSNSQDNFDPSSIIFESGFRPIRKSNGPVPPLGFEVEAPSSERKNPSLTESNIGPMDPIFIPSDLEKNRYNDPVPVPLPEAIVPVIPGPPQITFHPFQRPNPRPIQQLRPLPPVVTPPSPPPQRKSSSILSLFNFGTQRRHSTPGHLPSR